MMNIVLSIKSKLILLILVAGGALYYFKIVKPKKGA